ncbi:cupin domain-containing protein [Streptomyces sp. N2-109]|uniref:Cupin domain-containing protein n=1 Tax=Streptomyces gossypii TaxID=2883101 RepID=A0ABT2JNY2_9ACTN|nr:cupin domain-containing protein [Streptomyces gossypii]MCT2589531.1 cupin domain-containing protein [Streptomyces gossypii]
MTPADVTTTAAALPRAWDSHELAQVGPARVKVLRMNELPLAPEAHHTDETLLVMAGEMRLTLDGRAVTMRAGELCVIPAGTTHAVESGSHGTLLLVEIPDEGDG